MCAMCVLRDLRRQIGVVTQESLLFDDTVFNNIRYGSPHATHEQVVEAAKQAHAHRFIEQRLERGYETVIGPGGNRLSGGQRQRIALARAMLRDPAILILDEATSQIDLESELLIHKALEQFVRNRTAIIITHRLATLELADRVVVMQSGRALTSHPRRAHGSLRVLPAAVPDTASREPLEAVRSTSVVCEARGTWHDSCLSRQRQSAHCERLIRFGVGD